MTDQQLYLAIGVPILVNTATMLLGFTLMSNSLNKRIDDLRSDINSRLDLMSKLFTEQLRRVEDVMDARLKHLEEK